MKAHALSRPTWPSLHGHRQAAAWLRFATDRFLWLPLGAAIALVWANTAAESYFRLAHTLAFPVNEIGMAVFVGLITWPLTWLAFMILSAVTANNAAKRANARANGQLY